MKSTIVNLILFTTLVYGANPTQAAEIAVRGSNTENTTVEQERSAADLETQPPAPIAVDSQPDNNSPFDNLFKQAAERVNAVELQRENPPRDRLTILEIR